MSDQNKTMGSTIKDIANSVYDKAAGVASGISEKVNLHHTTNDQKGGKAVLGYWSIRGLAGYVRLMLEYCNEPYDEKVYGDMPQSFDQMMEQRAKHEGSEWFREKSSTGLLIPNIPYLYIDGHKISQSRAIVRYLGRKHRLEGKNENDKLEIDQIDEGLKDFLMHLAMVTYFTPKPQYPAAREKYITGQLPENLQLLSKHFGSDNRQYVAGNYVTYVDFTLYEYLDIQRLYAPEVVAKYSNLVAYMDRIENLPRVKDYLHSSRFVRTPVFMPFSSWDGTNRDGSSPTGKH